MRYKNKGIEDIMDIYSNCPSLLFGETTSHLTSKWRGTFQYFFNVENSIKREMRKNSFSKIFVFNNPPPPPGFFIFFDTKFFFNVGNSMKREEKYWKQKFILFFSIFKKFIKNSNIPSISKNYTAHGAHDMVHIPAQFRENTSMRFWVTVRKLNVMDGQTDGRGALQYLPSRAFGAAGDNKGK